MHVLLDEEQRRARARIVSSVRYTSSTTSGANPSDSSSAMSNRGFSTSTRERQHALLAARQRAGLLRAPLAEPREQPVGLVERGAHPAAAAGPAEGQLEVLLDRERREHRTPFGRVHHTEAGVLVRRHSGDVSPSSKTCTARRR